MTHQKKVRKRSRGCMKAEASKVNLDDPPRKVGSVHHRSAKVSNFHLANVCLQDLSRPLFKGLQNEDSTSSVPKVSHFLN